MIIGIVHEMAINDYSIYQHELFNSKDISVLGSYKLYPRFKSNALNNTISSGFFDVRNPRHKEFLIRVSEYESVLADINLRLDVSNDKIANTADIDAIYKHRLNVQDSRGFRALKDEHDKMKEFMLNKFRRYLKGTMYEKK
jgi:hypothetical protein